MGVETLLFIGVGLLALLFAGIMLSTTNAVHSALSLIANFGCVAFLFLMLDAPFLAMVQIAVYAGAIMVLFLFVIMLLKAEQGSDTTTRSFPRLPIIAAVLLAVLFGAISLPIASNGFALPTLKTPDPKVRFVNGSAVAEASLSVSGGSLTEPLTISNLKRDEGTSFETLPAGNYRVIVTDLSTGKPVGASQLTLNQGDVITAAAVGEFNPDTQSQVTLAPIPTDLSQAGEGGARLVIYNAIPEALDKDGNPIKAPVSLVDLGPEAAVTTKLVDGNAVLIDRILIPTIAKGEYGEATVAHGTHNLALLDPSFNIVERLDGQEIKTDTETLYVYGPEGGTGEGRVGAVVADTNPAFGSPKGVGRMLFTDYLLPVNLVGMLLLVALVGVIVLSRHEVEKPERRNNVRRKVSRPLVNVISTQTGSDVAEAPQLPTGDS